ncbi:MAG: hypothetical protein WCH99_14755 [Verrucomicrobiota bacterium]
MKTTPFKNRKLGAGMAFYAAVCFAGAAVFFAKSPTPNMALVFSAIAILNVVLGVVILKKGKQPRES